MSDSEEEEFSDIEEEEEEEEEEAAEEEEEEESDYFYGSESEEEEEDEFDERISEEEKRRRKAELKGQLEEQIKFEVAEWRKVKEIEDKILEKLKEKQAKRKVEREEEEAAAAEKKRQEEEELRQAVERKKQEEIEEKLRRKKDLETKRSMTMAVAVGAAKFKGSLRKLNPGKEPKKRVVQLNAASTSRDEIAKPPEQREEEKQAILAQRIVPLTLPKTKEELKAKAQEMFETIVRMNTEWYDLQEHGKKLDYDLREMREKWKMKMKQKALKKGMEPEAFTKKYPPKIQVASKFERREDTRSYGDKKKLFDEGWDVIDRQMWEKLWNERTKEFNKRAARGKKLPKWDPLAPKEKKKKTADKDKDKDPAASAHPTPPPSQATA